MPKIIINTQTPLTLKGKEALSIAAGKLVMVKYHVENDAVGDVLMRTSLNERPFVSLNSGVLWGSNLENYIFEEIIAEQIELS